ncbi:endonuclease [Arenicella chitinivorans]|uniref:Endonuclease n=1 Tax=Arenicella chitinivorans TaxID=1329800 RepID=A0A918S1T6_9GAMM|nr:endonuclease/exonuclease/phosphatase family protein [Arenicella chitinivorans]GHA19661.1 endonuclease [Arenicella chitinivorans]
MSRIFVIVLILVLVLAARKSKPAGDKAGHGLIGLPANLSEPDLLRVATYNIQTGKDANGRRDLLASARVMAAAHLVGVQEVYAPSLSNLLGIGRAQTQRIAEAGGFGWLFCATRRRWLREHRGNALLSKLQIKDWVVEMLPDQSNKSFRNMTVAEVAWKGQSFHFINTHLHTRGGRETQLELVLQEFAKYPRAILVGDFNSRAQTTALANALKDIDVLDAVSVAGLDLENRDRIDWILTRGFKVLEGQMVEIGVSDHPYYEVTLDFK